MLGDLLGGLRSLHQMLGQFTSALTCHEEFVFTDDGDHWAGVEVAGPAGHLRVPRPDRWPAVYGPNGDAHVEVEATWGSTSR